MEAIQPVFSGSEDVTIVYAKDQPEYTPLPTVRTEKLVVSRWKLTKQEREHIANGGDLFLFQMNFGQSLQPLMPVAADEETAMQVFIEQG